MSAAARCIFDTNILNEETLPQMSDLALSVFASLCGRNRGAFVLDPPDGQTYGCLSLPEGWSKASGITDYVIENSDDITKNYADGNITATQVMNLLELMNDAVYSSSANVQHDPYACNVNGLTTLDCALPTTTISGLKSVTLDGVLTPAPWGLSPKLTSTDFAEMQELGLTTVQIPISKSVMENKQEEIESILNMAQEAGLTAILQQIPSATKANKHNEDDEIVEVEPKEDLLDSLTQLALQYTDTVVAISILSADDIDIIRETAPDLTILVSINAGGLDDLNFDDDNVYASLEVNHAHVIADIASSSSVEDRSKLFYHESTSCILRSPIDFAQCAHQTPLFISGGFDLSIDDCIFSKTSDFSDYGQCDRFDETVESNWWHEHRQSFLNRQLFAFEQAQLGWSFSAWKTTTSSGEGISEPSHLLGLSHVAAAGLYPATNLTQACLNPPPPDFILGDETLSPTPGPPPDCGNGWWNYTTNECSYWIPPPVPTCAPALDDSTSPIMAGMIGAVVMGIVVWCTMIYGLGYNRRSANYDRIPN